MPDNLISTTYNNILFQFTNTPTSPQLIHEIFTDNYKIFERGLQFQPGDIILDIGANEGMFSIMMAKLFPFTRIIALEPVQKTFFTMIRNIGLNNVTNIHPYNLGVGGKSSKSEIIYCDKVYSGGSSMVVTPNFEAQDIVNIEVVAFDDIFDIRKFPEVNRVKLLKMDIEGAEYETLYNSTCLSRIDNMVAEFHINTRLESMGYDINELATWVGSKTNLVYFEKMRMAD
ncbi:MAG TPA: FkbM family methyltransferase [Candidatus Wunengus sp. YC60]|uniref:FkbM family methyltransferase n=1 Tax=Candidatus Wunengus sp. YC60 TaxID=3367697 RepID=UPI0040276CE9